VFDRHDGALEYRPSYRQCADETGKVRRVDDSLGKGPAKCLVASWRRPPSKEGAKGRVVACVDDLIRTPT
jgi:hypothetical protein